MSTEDERFHTVAKVGEIPEGQGRAFDVDGVMVAVFLDGGQYYAIEDYCPHQGAPLSDGIVYDKSVTCTWHGWRFDLQDGRHLEGSRSRVPTFPVRVVGDEIQVNID
ncbi:Rieske (2Fe-2S) protein [Tautonia marina]|uniref:Rieske (2Fe-2S) protein n=1 Tax=Tautonia marina TaxID=2653855 RepID=UPI0012610080|nr:Rieske (2Fe-2S) protein [Tautonia marina]